MNQQPLQEFTLRDFRCFREQQTARLAPLTLLVGENSTGKTSFLAAVRAMLQVGSYHEDPDFRAPPYDLGSFREIAYRQAPSGNRGGADSFGLGFKYAGEEEAISVDATFTLGDGAAPTLSTVRWSTDDVWVREHREADATHTSHGLLERRMEFATVARPRSALSLRRGRPRVRSTPEDRGRERNDGRSESATRRRRCTAQRR